MVTNWETFYGSPLRASRMSMEYVYDPDLDIGGFEIYCQLELIATIWYGNPENMSIAFLEWMNQECKCATPRTSKSSAR